MIYKIIKHSKVFKKKLQVRESDVSSGLQPDARRHRRAGGRSRAVQSAQTGMFPENLEIKPALRAEDEGKNQAERSE